MGISPDEQAAFELARQWLGALARDASERASSGDPEWVRLRDEYSARLR